MQKKSWRKYFEFVCGEGKFCDDDKTFRKVESNKRKGVFLSIIYFRKILIIIYFVIKFVLKSGESGTNKRVISR